MPLADDPQYLAFERQFNATEADLRGVAAHRKSQMARAYARQEGLKDEQLRQGTEGVMNDFAARGVSSSGVRVQKQNDLVREDTMRRSIDLGNNQDAMADVDYDLVRQLADLRRRRAEGGIASQQGAAVNPWKSYGDAYLGGQ